MSHVPSNGSSVAPRPAPLAPRGLKVPPVTFPGAEAAKAKAEANGTAVKPIAPPTARKGLVGSAAKSDKPAKASKPAPEFPVSRKEFRENAEALQLMDANGDVHLLYPYEWDTGTLGFTLVDLDENGNVLKIKEMTDVAVAVKIGDEIRTIPVSVNMRGFYKKSKQLP